MSDTINDIVYRMKNLKEFTINVDVPEGLQLHGVVPYDLSISGNKGKFKIYALSKEEAEQKIQEYLDRQQQ